MQDAPILVIEILEHVMPNPRGNLPIRSYQARVIDHRRVPARTTEFKIHLTMRSAVQDVLERMARTL